MAWARLPAAAAATLLVVDDRRGRVLRLQTRPSAAATPEDLRLRQVQVMTRHGHRTPLFATKSTPVFGSEAFHDVWGRCSPKPLGLPATTQGEMTSSSSLTADGGAQQSASSGDPFCGKADLTKLGEAELTRIGAFMRDSYGLQAPGPGQLEVLSTRTARTILSARALLRGLLPGHTASEVEAMVKFGPLPESMTADFERCHRLRLLACAERSRVEEDPVLRRTWAELEAAWGAGAEKSLVQAGDPGRAYRGAGLPLPPGFTEALADNLDECGHRIGAALQGAHSLDIRRLSIGRHLTKMQERFQESMTGTSAVRCVIWSAHDVSVGALLQALRIEVHRWPGFASSVHLQLLQSASTERWYVRIQFFDGPPTARGPDHEETMSYPQWRLRIAPVLLTQEEYVHECQLPIGAAMPPSVFY